MKNVLHIGTVIEGPHEFKSARLTNKERKQTITDEILSDMQIKDYSKRKYLEIQKEKSNKINFNKFNTKKIKKDKGHKKKKSKF